MRLNDDQLSQLAALVAERIVEFTPQPPLDTAAAAKFLGFSFKKMVELRTGTDGPAFVKLGRHVRYRPQDLAAWMREHRHA